MYNMFPTYIKQYFKQSSKASVAESYGTWLPIYCDLETHYKPDFVT